MAKAQSASPETATATFDRGPARYFHGREKILNTFDELAENAVKASGGSTFIVQGAPGAGKSALLYECEKIVRGRGWDVVDLVTPSPLWDPAALRRALGFGMTRNVVMGIVDVVTNKFTGTNLISNIPEVTPTTINVLEKYKKPLLLILDEAHTLWEAHKPNREQTGTITSVLNAIHNGKLGTPVIFLAAGLGETIATFREWGISRPSEGCSVELGALSKESEHAVIQDWLTKEAMVKGAPTTWIGIIAKETQGWPKHITSYARIASDQIKTDNGEMTAEGIALVLERGKEARSQYYEKRVDDFEGDEVICLSEAIADIRSGMSFKKELVLSPLTEKYGADKAKNLFRKFSEKGVISKDGLLHSVPIPSMHDWMKAELDRTRKKLEQSMEAPPEN
ncbi:MAG: hypothetical protein F4120_00840 [Rhodothermaceae bacterium]|nr:hypothetical protein [Rhodothermaceae bacterium]MXW34064.1 hypothetical protein [Rhodothermaceae bacterium]MYC04292.1 hypothetical protein [Rhodothermaceae bacterium]MYE64049.1 hypothetical protein [Rhodothermaceae bacterium]MYI16158.1 hypothetical protein [Rhodothermaceae bacterium]